MNQMINFCADITDLSTANEDYSINKNKIVELLINKATEKFNSWFAQPENQKSEIIDFKIIECISKEDRLVYIKSSNASICISVVYKSYQHNLEDKICPMLKLLKGENDKEFIKYLLANKL